jgi:predicted HicB family RNase H-like nuclease
MINEEKYSKTLRVRMDSELLEHVKTEAQKLDIDVSTYVRWCIRTGIYLEDLNKFIRSKRKEP